MTRTALSETLPVVLLSVLAAAFIQGLEWVVRGVGRSSREVLGRGRAERKTAARDRTRDDDDRPGWPSVDDVEAALEDLRRRAA